MSYFFKQLNLKKDNFWNYQIVIMWRFLNHNLKLQPEFYDFLIRLAFYNVTLFLIFI